MEPLEKPSYLNSALRFGGMLALISLAISYIGIYRFIGQPPAMSELLILFVATMISFLPTVLAGALVVRHYARTTDLPMTYGQGAVMGLVAGALLALYSVALNHVWTQLVDPNLLLRFAEATIANIEAIPDIPEPSRTALIDAAYQQSQVSNSLGNLLTTALGSILGNGLFNMLSGLLGVRLFAKKEEIL